MRVSLASFVGYGVVYAEIVSLGISRPKE